MHGNDSQNDREGVISGHIYMRLNILARMPQQRGRILCCMEEDRCGDSGCTFN